MTTDTTKTKINERIGKTKYSLEAQLEELRNQIAECDDEINWLKTAPLPFEDGVAKIDRFLENNQSIIDMSAFLSPQPIEANPFKVRGVPDTSAPVHVVNNIVAGGGHPVEVDLTPLFCSCPIENLKAFLVGQLENNMEHISPGPPQAERDGLIEAVLQRRRLLEIEEEALISECEDAGMEVLYRRYGFNPAIGFMKEADHA